AIILGGLNPTEVWWIDSLSGRWTTSTKYKTSLPKWMTKYNSSGWWRKQMGAPWVLSRPDKNYLNTQSVVAKPYGYKPSHEEQKRRQSAADIKALMYSHLSNTMVADAAKEAIIYNRLGGDQSTDVLNVCFDTPRRIAERYGLSSREVEDMYYRLDGDLADLITFASAQAGGKVLFTLTTDGSLREVKDDGKVFNVAQARFLINSFLSATYGKGEWVLGYADGSVWLNHTLIFSHALDLATLQRQVGTFCLGLRGVSHAIIASDMMAGDVKEGVVEVVQNGFYPKHSADIHLVLMPGWVSSEGDSLPKVSSSLPYAPYRKAVMVISGEGVESRRVKERVDVRELVVLLAERLGVELPLGADV
ncbi:MAG: alkaline phosphatase family protein, partial [Tidjanibacter sp.]|nr:alkaline phosphatase family protein [Tidjanibacter sp.]